MTRIIVIDPNFTLESPSMKGIVRAVPDLLKAGLGLEVWCWNHEKIPGVHFRILPRIPAPSILMGWAFFVVAHLHWIGWKLGGRDQPKDLLISTGFYLLPADVTLIHFSVFDWMKAQRRIGFHTIRDWLELAYSIFCRVPAEILLLWNPWPTLMVAVSRSVGEDMRRWGAPWKSVSLLPNPYDPKRFNENVRLEERAGARRGLGIPEGDKVFVFASAGHYRRKGFWLAVGAVHRLRAERSDIHLLVIGGSRQAITLLQKRADAYYPGWKEWLHFTGMTREMPSFLAAGDALLFPSYSEAFALVEIEAAAMGLRLYLTPHHGSEMILRDGINGRLLPWHEDGIARIIEHELVAGLVTPGPCHHGEASPQSEYASRLMDILGICEKADWREGGKKSS